MLNATLKRSLILWAVATAMVASLGSAAGAQDPGALISMTLKGTVGVLLDEVPPGHWPGAPLLAVVCKGREAQQSADERL